MKIKNSIKSMIVLCGLVGMMPAFAVTQSNMTINMLGVNTATSGKAYVGFVEPLSITCSYDLVYISLSTDGGKAAYATLLSAKMSDKKISRIDYAIDPANGVACLASIIAVQD